jgi:hypothetical protein
MGICLGERMFLEHCQREDHPCRAPDFSRGYLAADFPGALHPESSLTPLSGTPALLPSAIFRPPYLESEVCVDFTIN